MKLTRLLVVLVLVIVVGATALLLSAGQTPESTAADFMKALAQGDASALADIGYLEGKDHNQAREEWRQGFAYSRHFIFRYQIERTLQPNDNSASVTLQVIRGHSESPEHFELPLMKKDGKWRVNVRGISHEMHPGLPR